MTAAIFADFFVCTVPEWELRNGALLPTMVARLVREPRKQDLMYGFYGWRGKQSFLGVNERGDMLFQATGSWASATAQAFTAFVDKKEVSVARLDLQTTIRVENADRIVTTIRPSRRYKAYIYAQLFSPGATLYIGAPASERRMRVYNKSAESGVYPESGEWLRVELQTRNRYADRLWRACLKGCAEGNFLEAVRSMADENTYRLLRDAGFDVDAPVFEPEDDEPGDWLQRRVDWLAHTVMPALRKLVLHSDEGREAVRVAFEQIMQYNRVSAGATDGKMSDVKEEGEVCR